MKKVFILVACVIFSLSVFGQTVENSDEVGIDEMYFAKDDGEGKAGDVAEKFTTTDIPIHCIVQLNSKKSTTVKMIFVAVNVKGVKAETKVITTIYKTNGKQNRVRFTGKPEDIWEAGKYRVDIFLDGKLTKSQELEIEKSTTETTQINKFQPTAKPKSTKRPRKN